MSERTEAQLEADLISEKWDEGLRGFAPWQYLPASPLREQCIGVGREEAEDAS